MPKESCTLVIWLAWNGRTAVKSCIFGMRVILSWTHQKQEICKPQIVLPFHYKYFSSKAHQQLHEAIPQCQKMYIHSSSLSHSIDILTSFFCNKGACRVLLANPFLPYVILDHLPPYCCLRTTTFHAASQSNRVL